MASVLIILPEEEINWFVSLSLSSLLLYQLLCKQRDQESAYLINKMCSIVTLALEYVSFLMVHFFH